MLHNPKSRKHGSDRGSFTVDAIVVRRNESGDAVTDDAWSLCYHYMKNLICYLSIRTTTTAFDYIPQQLRIHRIPYNS